MWKNILKNVEPDNNKILYETFLDFFYSETALTFWISFVYSVELYDDGWIGKELEESDRALIQALFRFWLQEVGKHDAYT
jgi:hypothetical protein